MKRIVTIIAIIVIGLLVVSFVVQKETKPSNNTRVILEHTYSTYVTPTCFNDADVTNFLEDSTLGTAIQMEYEPHDKCTEESLLGEKESLFVSVLKDIGIMKKKWDNW